MYLAFRLNLKTEKDAYSLRTESAMILYIKFDNGSKRIYDREASAHPGMFIKIIVKNLVNTHVPTSEVKCYREIFSVKDFGEEEKK